MHFYLYEPASGLGVACQFELVRMASMLSHGIAGSSSAVVTLLQGHCLLQHCTVMPAIDTAVSQHCHHTTVVQLGQDRKESIDNAPVWSELTSMKSGTACHGVSSLHQRK